MVLSVKIDEERIGDTLRAAAGPAAAPDAGKVRDALARARRLQGLDDAGMAALMNLSDPELLGELFAAAREVKDAIYGSRLVLFAPLYISNLCANECSYCAFRARNRAVTRRALTQPEIARETRALIAQGHKRVLMVAGESYPHEGFSYILDSIATIYAARQGAGEIRRVNVNIAPLAVEEFALLKDAGIGTFQLFQETYHRATYARVHLAGRKRDFDWRLGGMHRAMAAGLGDVGVGILFGLFDWRFELLALMQHIRALEADCGVGPHTISVPRLEPALGSDVAAHPPHAVSDPDFRKLVAILRLAVPYTGIIMSTRETSQLRRETFALGVSQISAGSRTNPGGYSKPHSRPLPPEATESEPLTQAAHDHENDLTAAAGQFSLGDHRGLDEVVRDVAELGYIPSFCTACYRLGRTGQDFMDLARPGEIKNHCDPNALSTFLEYLIDYASAETREAGEKRIAAVLGEMADGQRMIAEKLLSEVREGKRDVFV